MHIKIAADALTPDVDRAINNWNTVEMGLILVERFDNICDTLDGITVVVSAYTDAWWWHTFYQ